MKKLFKWEPKKELILVFISLIWLWFAYYGADHIYGNSILLQLIIWVIITVIIICVCFPAWWIVKKQKEGFTGLGITKNKIGLSIILAICLAIWRGIELLQYIKSPNLPTTLLFNVVSIWEVFFLFSWLFTRYESSFGKIPAIILTSLSTGLYHIGTLKTENIIYLCFCICIIGICFSITKNIFTLWPLYWIIGCSASTLRSGMEFDWMLISVFTFVLIVQIGYLVYLKKISR